MEVESYLDLLADMAAGKTGGGTGKTYVNQRLLRKRRSAQRGNKGGR